MWVKKLQTTPWGNPVAFVDNNLCEGLPFFAASTRRAIEAMLMKSRMVVAMGCFAASSASFEWSSYHLILTTAWSYGESK
jgi:hypothetical protein